MKQYIIFWLGGVASLLLFKLLYNPTKTPITYHHPEIKSAMEVYQIPLSDSVSDVCYDIRSKQVVVIEGYFIQQRCELDSNRWHFNIKTK